MTSLSVSLPVSEPWVWKPLVGGAGVDLWVVWLVDVDDVVWGGRAHSVHLSELDALRVAVGLDGFGLGRRVLAVSSGQLLSFLWPVL